MQFLYHVANKHEVHPPPCAKAVCISQKFVCRIFQYNGGTASIPRIILFSLKLKRTCLKAQQLQTGSEEDRLQMGP